MDLDQDRYGKCGIRLLRLRRGSKRHHLHEVKVDVLLEGRFEAAYTDADNSSVVATDTMKNLVQLTAAESAEATNEALAQAVARCFLDRYPQVDRVATRVEEVPWQRLIVDGGPHPHSFAGSRRGTPFAGFEGDRGSGRLVSGVRDLAILKSTGSSFRGYLQDDATTLGETDDRILATRLEACWTLSQGASDFRRIHRLVEEAMLRVFATTHSHSVQDTLFRMGNAALEEAPEISEIHLKMPNLHYLEADLTPLRNEVEGRLFVPTSEPHGHIEATVHRGRRGG